MNRLTKLAFEYNNTVRNGIKLFPPTLRLAVKQRLPFLAKFIYSPVFSPFTLLLVLYISVLKNRKKIIHPLKVLKVAEEKSKPFIISGDYEEAIRIYKRALFILENKNWTANSSTSKSDVIWLIKNKIKELEEEL